MIGGIDIGLSGATTAEDLDLLLHVVRARWPGAFVETGDGDRAMAVHQALRTGWSIPCELFIYESEAAWRQWSEHGFTDDGAARMISLTVETDAISFVVNTDGSPSALLVEDIKRAVCHRRRVPKIGIPQKAA